MNGHGDHTYIRLSSRQWHSLYNDYSFVFKLGPPEKPILLPQMHIDHITDSIGVLAE